MFNHMAQSPGPRCHMVPSKLFSFHLPSDRTGPLAETRGAWPTTADRPPEQVPMALTGTAVEGKGEAWEIRSAGVVSTNTIRNRNDTTNEKL